MKKRFLGFTLSETLITVAILGVIAMLTIPGIIRNYQKRVWVTQLQRWYSEMSNTIDEFVVYNKGLETFNQNVNTGVVNNLTLNDTFLIKFLNEKYEVSTNLWKNKNNEIDYRTLHGAKGPGSYPDLYYHGYRYEVYRTKSGAQFGICFSKESDGSRGWKIVVDVNGPKKGPNVVGRDTFHFYVDNTSRSLMPRKFLNAYLWSDWKTSTYEEGCNMQSTHKFNGVLCAKKLIENGWKMDY